MMFIDKEVRINRDNQQLLKFCFVRGDKGGTGISIPAQIALFRRYAREDFTAPFNRIRRKDLGRFQTMADEKLRRRRVLAEIARSKLEGRKRNAE